MVAKTILEVIRYEGTQWITLVLTLLLEHIWSSKDVTIVLLTLDQAQLTLRSIHKILGNTDVIK
jgi:hypothetical protein